MNCSTANCRTAPVVHEPVPLCGTCALLVLAAYAEANLANQIGTITDRQTDARTEIRTIYQLLDAEGWNGVDLRRTMEVLKRPKATAAKRLAEARKQYAAELNRRAGRSRRETEIDTVLELIEQAGDPRSVSLEDVMARFGLKQTTAFDRLDAARKAWAQSGR